MFLKLKIKIAHKLKLREIRKNFKNIKSLGRNFYIGSNYNISSIEKLEIGENVYIGENFYAKCEGGLSIKSGTIIAKDCEIWTCNHNYHSKDLYTIPYDRRFVYKSVIINENVWIGSRVTIIPGIEIGEGAVIGAGSVVTQNVPPYSVVGGNPAKVIKYRNINQYKELKNNGKIYLDIEYNFDKSPIRKSEY